MLVSLLISTYNWKEALSLCLYSAFAQTVKPAEILIADDGSREDTRQLIDEMRAKQIFLLCMCGMRIRAFVFLRFAIVP